MCRTFRQVTMALLFVAVASGVTVAEHRVTFVSQEGSLLIRVDDRPLATYVYRDPEILRPYFKDVYSPAGVQVTRHHPPRQGIDPVDHATMHPGLWLAFGDLGGADFWRNKATVEHVGFTMPPRVEGAVGTFSVHNRYMADGTAVCDEVCTYTFQVHPAGYQILWDSTFSSETSGFYFGDQEEMGLGIRLATPMMVKPYEGRHRPGRILDDHGRLNEKGIWGKPAAWCDYGGWLGDTFAGILVMPDPSDDRPCRWHTRDYGFMAANPFGWKAFKQGPARRTEVKAGQSFRLRFGLLVHAAPSEDAVDLAAAYEDYLSVQRQN